MVERKQIKTLKKALIDLKRLVENPNFLRTGRKPQNFSLLPREILANWLLCAVIQKAQHTNKIVFAEDDRVDGLIVDKSTGRYVETEHVSVLNVPFANLDGEKAIVRAINSKIKNGSEYAKGKILIVFSEGIGKWYRNRVRVAINGRHNFKGVVLIGLLTQDENGYAYSVTELARDDSKSYKVLIKPGFTEWVITPLG